MGDANEENGRADWTGTGMRLGVGGISAEGTGVLDRREGVSSAIIAFTWGYYPIVDDFGLEVVAIGCKLRSRVETRRGVSR